MPAQTWMGFAEDSRGRVKPARWWWQINLHARGVGVYVLNMFDEMRQQASPCGGLAGH
uniref:Uncharacterized protein n=1 Tax=Oryza officinalis TaxID=4535 RepID=A0A1V1H3M6_9ORYZ|nr:hypothetical protein [Oryza officinalis]